MGIDFTDRKSTKSTARKELKSPNPYLKLLSQLYEFLARRTGSRFNEIVAKRLNQSKRFKAVTSLQKVVKVCKGKEDKIAVVVGTITSKMLFE